MSVGQPLPTIDDSDWQVPVHDVALYGEKRHRHALVIPVINEGDRIRGQLLRTMQAALPVDVIVADGGSTDGSLDPDFIRTVNVRAVLTKTGPGKLSAQLRMAYAWCLREGYEGIVTIDGNGKDGVEAVAAMVEKLDAGCDYVQGSRYLPGGQAENTPLERTIANRLIHAPILSLAGRHFFTDTTNGFRAYSAHYLTHPLVRPFRDEFQVYGLLFYLTVRAGQLGLKVDQVPVVRIYPDDGKVPTKIGGLASKLALLGETVFAATGGHTPDAAATHHPPSWWAWLIAFAVLLPLFLVVVANPPFSPDSWAFYELSRTVFGDFYRFSHWRSYADAGPYSSAFPPLYPALIALVDGAFGTGPRTGLYLAFGALSVFAWLSERIGRQVTGAAWVGLAAALVLLLGPQMLVVELEAGRTIPLQLCLYALVLVGLLKRSDIGLRSAVGIGFVAGLAVLNRFDAVLLPLLSAGAIIWFTRKPALALAALGASAMAVSPWIAYSLATFGVVFATDNSGVVTTLDPRAFVTDWWPVAQPALADDPGAWLARVTGNVVGFVESGAALVLGPMGASMLAAVTIVFGAHALASRRPGRADQPASAALGVIGVFAAMTAVMMGPQVLTGYLEYRYFTALFWTVFLLIGCWTVTRGVTVPQRIVFARLFALVALIIALPFYGFHVARQGERAGDDWSQFEHPGDVATLKACVTSQPGARILVLGDNNFAARAGALAGLATMMEPRNMVEGRLGPQGSRAFAVAWKVDFVLVRGAAQREFARSTFDLAEVPDCPLEFYRLSQSVG